MGKRRKGREYSLQLLYQYDLRRDPPEALLKEFWAERKNVHKDIRAFATAIFLGTLEHVDKIDEVIAELALNWKLSRLSLIDKNILRSAIYEIIFRDDIPEKVSVDEAIEVAKRFSGEDAGGFINGLLDTVLKNREYFMGKLTAASP